MCGVIFLGVTASQTRFGFLSKQINRIGSAWRQEQAQDTQDTFKIDSIPEIANSTPCRKSSATNCSKQGGEHDKPSFAAQFTGSCTIFSSHVKVRPKAAPQDLDSLAAVSNKLDATEEIRKLRRTRETKKKMMSPRRSNRQGGSCARRNRRRWRRSKPLLPTEPRETQTPGASCTFRFSSISTSTSTSTSQTSVLQRDHTRLLACVVRLFALPELLEMIRAMPTTSSTIPR